MKSCHWTAALKNLLGHVAMLEASTLGPVSTLECHWGPDTKRKPPLVICYSLPGWRWCKAERRRGSQQCGVGRQKVLALLDYICVSIKGHTSHYLNVKTWNSFPQRASTWSYSSLGALSHLRQHLSASTASQSADLTNCNSQVFPIFTFPDSDWAWSSQFTVSHQSHCMSVTTTTHDHVFLGLSQLAHTITFFFF